MNPFPGSTAAHPAATSHTAANHSATRRLLAGPAPGILLCLVVGALCMLISQYLSSVSALLIAIVLGALWRNLAAVPRVLDDGVGFSAKKLLRLGIVLLGFQLSLGSILSLGPSVLLVVLAAVAVTFLLTAWIGKLMGLELEQRLLIAIGFSICGAAAVAGAEGTLKAKEHQVATAVGLVVLFGTLMIPAMPALGLLLGLDDQGIGMLVGASTHEVAQVVAGAGSVSAAALAVAVTVKLARVLLLAPVVAGVGLYMRRQHSVRGDKHPPLVPLFILGFLSTMLLRTTIDLPEALLNSASTVQTLLLSASMFALGLGVNLRSIFTSGIKALLLGLIATLTIITVAASGTALFPPA
ncbi:putative sulfate exporter family transporter [Glutamicibacter sp. JL.03c]|uniref:YeiH family protein n=1 Tax=Glutamicibacter sp. JL.03c TaxID=2984842 RepID=UPI0021F7CB31|nr:putative sulfate exporter family transporter [Glutamicibacter sp. JL.03c]UYQ77042.1 putative sulfate exporter family transporter [Glutamicibacter sp. JL.03c]